MAELKFLSYNVKGLNSAAKRSKVLDEIKHYKANVVFLQETHLSLDSNIRLYSPTFPLWYYGDSTSKRARGVAIGFANGTGFALEARLTDPEGRYLFLKGKIGSMVCTLANIYAPNANPIKYTKE